VITKKELKLRTNPKKKKDLSILPFDDQNGKENSFASLSDQIENNGKEIGTNPNPPSPLPRSVAANIDSHEFVWGDKRVSIGEAMKAYSQPRDECYSAPWYWLVSEVERLRNGTIKLSDFDRFVAKEWAGIEQARASLTIKEKAA
jgi:hypothetical protein